ncbi:MAG TPA: hypothetical protein VNV86_02395 [Candidatus Acidoferrum sp.]|nr:hypothetical protein [Candidatus Acidoferrum sp.]
MKRTTAALAILLVLTAAFYWKLTLTSDWTWLEGPDFAIQVRPWLDLGAREFHAGRIPLWDPYEWAGHTLIGQVQPGIANPLNWILFAMPLRDGHIPISTLHWYWVLIHWLGAVFAYALCRDLGASFFASLFGGCLFALTGFMGHTDWPQILMASLWIPVVLLFFFRVVRDQRPLASAALAGSAMGVAFLGTHHVVPTFTALLISGCWLALVIARPRRAVYFAVFVSITALVAAVQVLPAMEYSRLAIRWAGAPDPILPGQRVPFSVHAEYSLKLSELPAMLLPRGATHVNPYVGLTAFALAVLAVVRRRSAATPWLVAIVIGAVAIALASPPYWLVYRFVPMVEKAREPAFAIVIAQCAIAALAALGLSRLPVWVPPVALVVFLGEAVYHAPRFNRIDRRDSYLAMQRDQAGVMAFLRAQPGWFRVEFDDAVVPYNAGDLYGIEQFGGAVSSMPLRVQRVLGHEETARTFGVRYRVAAKASNSGQVELFRSPSGVAVFEDRRIGEPMWSVRATPCAAPDSFRLLAREPERVVMEARMGCEGLAVIGDPFYPGWRAYLDGRRVPMQEVDGVRAVRVGAGAHRIEYRYRPISVYVGFGLSVMGLVLAVLLVGRGQD